MTTKFVKKPTFSLDKLSSSMTNYLESHIHISKFLNQISKQDIPEVIEYLKSLLKFNSLYMTKNNLTDENSQTKLIRQPQYLLLVLTLIQDLNLNLNITHSFFNKFLIKQSFKFNKQTSSTLRSVTFEFPDFVPYYKLLPVDSLSLKTYEGNITRHAITFLDLSFYVKDNSILFFNDQIYASDFMKDGNLSGVELEYLDKNKYNKYKNSYDIFN